MCPTFSASLETNSSSIDLCTRNRSEQTQVCPAFRNFDDIAAFTATSRSASSNTMKDALPPSSSDNRFTVSLLCFISSLPTGVLPVNEIFFMILFTHISSPTSLVNSRSAVTNSNTPSGTPALFASVSKAIAVNGVNSLGFKTQVHPAASAGPTLRVIIAIGKFHGVMRPQTPTASLIAIILPLGAPSGVANGLGEMKPPPELLGRIASAA
mmetsp:Transcript_16838/g.25590  ORF Transcript_16838/g.25590 Transcript_16838/m.25590 type:complete len:211 (-) Transcript_16838:595-1227(-)